MGRNRRQPHSLQFRGWWVDGPELRVQARMVVQMANGSWQGTGPNLTMIVPAHALLQEGIADAAAWAQHQQEIAQKIARAADTLLEQDPLF